MARISPRLKREAYRISPLLFFLLGANRSIESARQELYWIQEELPRNKWWEACLRRNRLEPLQYILGTQPFGDLDILCQKDVLIPRHETEEWTLKLCKALRNLGSGKIKIMDACSGTGCISLLLYYELRVLSDRNIDITGFDISKRANALSKSNLRNLEKKYGILNSAVRFFQGNLFHREWIRERLPKERYDLIVSNPPYVPLLEYNAPRGIEKSVKLYESADALIGTYDFYKALIHFVKELDTKGFVFEIGDISQYEYVRDFAANQMPNWKTLLLCDSGKRPRCIIGWLSQSPMEVLQEMLHN